MASLRLPPYLSATRKRWTLGAAGGLTATGPKDRRSPSRTDDVTAHTCALLAGQRCPHRPLCARAVEGMHGHEPMRCASAVGRSRVLTSACRLRSFDYGSWRDAQPSVTAGASPATAAVDATLSCEPSPRLRLGGVEYEVRTFDGVVAEQDVGEVFAEDLVLPSAITDCVPFVVLRDGEGSLPAGTTVYEIVGVDPAEALTASYGTATTSGSWPTPNCRSGRFS